MTQDSPVPTPRDPFPSDVPVREAFRELHGRRLHGFALLLTLGDRRLAARFTANALAAADPHLAQLRHPERAAAWLRARVLRLMPRRSILASPTERRAALEPLGAEAAIIEGLAAVGTRERAALIAADVERLDPRDVETIVGRGGAALERLLIRARRRYIDAYATLPIAAGARDEGALVRRVRSVAERTMT